MKVIIWFLFISLVIYNILDVYQTKLLLDVGAVEINPFLKWTMDITGTWKVIIYIKMFFISILGIGIFLYTKSK